MSEKQFVDQNNARPGEPYEAVIKDIAARGVCPFCEGNIRQFHTKPLEEAGRHWLVTENMYPYKGTRHHLLLIHREHVEHFSELSAEAWSELLPIARAAAEQRGISGGTFIMRFGETAFTGASVNHLHAHIVQVDPDHPDYETEKKMIGLAIRIG